MMRNLGKSHDNILIEFRQATVLLDMNVIVKKLIIYASVNYLSNTFNISYQKRFGSWRKCEI